MTRDRWAEWLAERRFGGDAEYRRDTLDKLRLRRDEVLDRARLAAGDSLLDVGCGEGLIGFGALERGAGKVVFSDVSDDLLAFCREVSEDLGVADRCEFVRASADDLEAVASGSVDVVATRSVLIYVADKPGAFREFFRVLRPDGRISLYEPINSFARTEAPGRFCGYDVGLLPEAEKLRALYEARQPADSDPMLDFDERDLLRLCEEAGFFPVELCFLAEIGPLDPRRWESFLNTAGNPNIPTPGEAMEQALAADERERLTARLRPLVEAGRGTWRMGHALLSGTKPG